MYKGDIKPSEPHRKGCVNKGGSLKSSRLFCLNFAHWLNSKLFQSPISEQVWRASLRILIGILESMTDD